MTVNKRLSRGVTRPDVIRAGGVVSERHAQESPMLYLTRKSGQAVIINNDIEVRVVELRGKSVKLGFTFPSSASVLREEVFAQIRDENLAAATTAASLPTTAASPDADAIEAVPSGTRSGEG